MSLGFDVPAEYFYALTAQLPATLDLAAGFQFATTNSPDANLTTIQAAIDAAVIPKTAGTPAVTPEQAAWRLAALGGVTASAPTFSLATYASSVLPSSNVQALVAQWLAYNPPASSNPLDPETDLAGFWNGVVFGNATLMAGQLALALVAMAHQNDLTALFDALVNGAPHLPPLPPNAPGAPSTAVAFTVASVKDLDPSAYSKTPSPAISFTQWLALFANSLPAAIPLFAIVGTGWTPGPTPPSAKQLQQQTTAFVLRLTQFFGAPGFLTVSPSAPAAGTLPQLPTPSGIDPFTAFLTGPAIKQYGATDTLDPTAAGDAAQNVFPTDPRAQAWLLEARTRLRLRHGVDVMAAPRPARVLLDGVQVRTGTLKDPIMRSDVS